MRDLPEEVTFFARSAAFALVIATIYWFVSYEPAGTTLLAFFAEKRQWPVDVVALYLWWVWVGGEITVAIRFRRNLTAASQSP